MLEKVQLTYLIVICTFLGRIKSSLAQHDTDFEDADVFHVTEIDSYELGWSSTMQKLNNFLVEHTESADPEENFDIVLEELILNHKNAVRSSKALEVKRLFLALDTLRGENECNYYGFLVLDSNLRAMDPDIGSVIRNENLRRIDKILAHFIHRHIRNCKEGYFKKFDEISKNLDPVKMERIKALVKKPIETLASKKAEESQGKSYVEILFDAATDGLSSSFDIEPSLVYTTMVDLVKGDPDERFIRKVENERYGVPSINEEKFSKLFNKYIAEPCEYYKQLLRFDVFEPILFDSMFDKEIKSERVDFYESWCKYQMCKYIGPMKRNAVLNYANRNK